MNKSRRMLSDDFGKLLKKYREEKGMSIRQLGEKASVNGSYIHRLETGERRRPGTFIVEDIANALGIEPAILIGIDYRKRNGEEIELEELVFSNEVIYQGQILNSETKDTLLDIIKIALESKWNRNTMLADLNEVGEAISLLKETL